LRMHQRGAKPLTTDISRSLGSKKYLYFNYPRFVNLSTTPPERLDLINKVRYFSPEVQVRDISDALAKATPPSSLRGRLEDAVVHFEASHPTLARRLATVIDTLALYGL